MRKFWTIPLAVASLAAQTLPVAVHGPLAVIEVRLNGEGPYRMVLDTGSTDCSIRPEVARSLHLKPEFRTLNVTPAGSNYVLGTAAVTVDLGGHIAKGISFTWHDSLGSEQFRPRVDGILGQSFLSTVDYLLDYKGKRLVVTSDDESIPGLGEQIPFVRNSGQMVVSAGDRGQGAMRLVLDSGASNLYLWREGPWRVIENSAQMVTAGGGRTVKMVDLPYLAVGGHVLHRLETIIAPSATAEEWKDGLLPSSLFRSMYVSNSQAYVRFQKW